MSECLMVSQSASFCITASETCQLLVKNPLTDANIAAVDELFLESKT